MAEPEIVILTLTHGRQSKNVALYPSIGQNELNDILVSAFDINRPVIGFRVRVGADATSFPLSQVCAAPQILSEFQSSGAASESASGTAMEEEIIIELVLAGEKIESIMEAAPNANATQQPARSKPATGQHTGSAAAPARAPAQPIDFSRQPDRGLPSNRPAAAAANRELVRPTGRPAAPPTLRDRDGGVVRAGGDADEDEDEDEDGDDGDDGVPEDDDADRAADAAAGEDEDEEDPEFEAYLEYVKNKQEQQRRSASAPAARAPPTNTAAAAAGRPSSGGGARSSAPTANGNGAGSYPVNTSALRDVVVLTVLVGHDSRKIGVHSRSTAEDVRDALRAAFPALARKKIFGFQQQKQNERDAIPQPIALSEVGSRIAQLARFPFVKLIDDVDVEYITEREHKAWVEMSAPAPAPAPAATSRRAPFVDVLTNRADGARLIATPRDLAVLLASSGSKPVNLVVYSRDPALNASCVEIAEVFDRLNRLCSTQRFAKIDISVLQQTPFGARIRAVPAVLIFVGGELITFYENGVTARNLEFTILETENTILTNVGEHQKRGGPLADLLDDDAQPNDNDEPDQESTPVVVPSRGRAAAAPTVNDDEDGDDDDGDDGEDEDDQSAPVATADGYANDEEDGEGDDLGIEGDAENEDGDDDDDDDGVDERSAAPSSTGASSSSARAGSTAAPGASSAAAAAAAARERAAAVVSQRIAEEVQKDWDGTTPLISREEKAILDRMLRREDPEVKAAYALVPELGTLVRVTLRFGVLIAKGFERTIEEQEQQNKQLESQRQQNQRAAPAAAAVAAPTARTDRRPVAAPVSYPLMSAGAYRQVLAVMEEVGQISHQQNLLLQVLFERQHTDVMAALLAYENNEEVQDLMNTLALIVDRETERMISLEKALDADRKDDMENDEFSDLVVRGRAILPPKAGAGAAAAKRAASVTAAGAKWDVEDGDEDDEADAEDRHVLGKRATTEGEYLASQQNSKKARSDLKAGSGLSSETIDELLNRLGDDDTTEQEKLAVQELLLKRLQAENLADEKEIADAEAAEAEADAQSHKRKPTAAASLAPATKVRRTGAVGSVQPNQPTDEDEDEDEEDDDDDGAAEAQREWERKIAGESKRAGERLVSGLQNVGKSSGAMTARGRAAPAAKPDDDDDNGEDEIDNVEAEYQATMKALENFKQQQMKSEAEFRASLQSQAQAAINAGDGDEDDDDSAGDEDEGSDSAEADPRLSAGQQSIVTAATAGAAGRDDDAAILMQVMAPLAQAQDLTADDMMRLVNVLCAPEHYGSVMSAVATYKSNRNFTALVQSIGKILSSTGASTLAGIAAAESKKAGSKFVAPASVDDGEDDDEEDADANADEDEDEDDSLIVRARASRSNGAGTDDMDELDRETASAARRIEDTYDNLLKQIDENERAQQQLLSGLVEKLGLSDDEKEIVSELLKAGDVVTWAAFDEFEAERDAIDLTETLRKRVDNYRANRLTAAAEAADAKRNGKSASAARVSVVGGSDDGENEDEEDDGERDDDDNNAASGLDDGPSIDDDDRDGGISQWSDERGSVGGVPVSKLKAGSATAGSGAKREQLERSNATASNAAAPSGASPSKQQDISRELEIVRVLTTGGIFEPSEAKILLQLIMDRDDVVLAAFDLARESEEWEDLHETLTKVVEKKQIQMREAAAAGTTGTATAKPPTNLAAGASTTGSTGTKGQALERYRNLHVSCVSTLQGEDKLNSAQADKLKSLFDAKDELISAAYEVFADDDDVDELLDTLEVIAKQTVAGAGTAAAAAATAKPAASASVDALYDDDEDEDGGTAAADDSEPEPSLFDHDTPAPKPASAASAAATAKPATATATAATASPAKPATATAATASASPSKAAATTSATSEAAQNPNVNPTKTVGTGFGIRSGDELSDTGDEDRVVFTVRDAPASVVPPTQLSETEVSALKSAATTTTAPTTASTAAAAPAAAAAATASPAPAADKK